MVPKGPNPLIPLGTGSGGLDGDPGDRMMSPGQPTARPRRPPRLAVSGRDGLVPRGKEKAGQSRTRLRPASRVFRAQALFVLRPFHGVATNPIAGWVLFIDEAYPLV